MLSQCTPSPRRTRAPIACHRCKRRKTKCNGEIPICSACKKLGINCTWPAANAIGIAHAAEQSQILRYTARLEQKVADLEARLQSQRTTERQPAHANDDPAPTPNSTSGAPVRHNYNGELSSDTVLLSMNATAEPFFLGPTSGFSLSKLVEGILSESLSTERDDLGNQHSQTDIRETQLTEEMNTASVQATDVLIETYFSKVHPRYPFIDRRSFYDFINRRKSAPSEIECDPSELFILYAVCAIGARVVQLHPELDKTASPEIYFAKALKHFDAVTARQSLVRTQALLLLAIYLLRKPGSVINLGTWHIIGLAVRCAVEMGLHRDFRGQQGRKHSSYAIEIRRRTFWVAYILDRSVSLTLGRPFALVEHDIRVPNQLPVEIDDTTNDESTIQLAQQNRSNPGETFSNLSSFIHMCRLRRIESKIQQEIFGAEVETRISDGSYDDRIDGLREKLDSWRKTAPAYESCVSQQEHSYSFYHTKEFLDIQYSKALRMLLQPRITTTKYFSADTKTSFYLSLSARAAGDICQYYKSLHQRRPLGWDLLSLNSIFMAGLTLLYCVWTWKEKPNISLFEDIRACSNVLFAISERWPTAKRFRDVFELLARKFTEIVNNSQVAGAEAFEEGCGLGAEGTFPSPGFENFWSTFDDLVNDEYIRDQFMIDDEEQSAFMDFSY